MTNKQQYKKGEFVEGKLYLKRSDVWAVDYGNPGFIIVFIRDTSFKVQPDCLVLIGDTSE